MKVSWIDADAFRSLADSLLEPEQREVTADDSLASEASTPEPLIEEDVTTVASQVSEIPELPISAEDLHPWDEEEAPYMPDSENLKQIRRGLETLSDRASNAGIIREMPFEEEELFPNGLPEASMPAPSQELRDAVNLPEVTNVDPIPEPTSEITPTPLPPAPEVSASHAPEETPDFPEPPVLDEKINQQVGLQDLKKRVFGVAPVTTNIPVPKVNEASFNEASLQLPEWPVQEETEDLSVFTPKPPPVEVPPLAFDGVLPTNTGEIDPDAFTPIEGDLAARLDHYVSWASHLTGTHEALLLDQHGDLMWGQGRCSDLVASSILAINTHWRSSALNLAQRYPFLNMRLNEKRVLAILPCTTRFGQITLGLVLTDPMEAPKAAELAEALIATVNHT